MSDEIPSLLSAFDAVGAIARVRAEHSDELHKLFLDLLAVMDSLDRLGNSATETSVGLVRLQLEQVLQRHDVVPILAIGSRFDPHLHKACGYKNVADVIEDTIIEQWQRGYLWNGELLRAPLVVVARTGQPSSEESSS